MIKGCSTGCPPIHASVKRFTTRIQNRHWLNGQNVMLCCLHVWSNGINTKIRIEKIRAKILPSLLGLDRRTAYVNKKYHSGLMCEGVLRGLPGCSYLGLLVGQVKIGLVFLTPELVARHPRCLSMYNIDEMGSCLYQMKFLLSYLILFHGEIVSGL